MTRQRLSETDEEYEKRKKRVTATYRNLGFGLAHGSISTEVEAAALIEYTWSADSYALNGSDEVIVTNQGSSGTTNDLLLNTGEPIEVSAGQEFDVPVEADSDCVAYYNITTKAWVYQTSISSPSWTIGQGTFGIIATLKTEPDATDKTRLDAEPWQILNLWFEETTNLTSIVKADIQHLYNPNVLQTSTLYDLADTDDITVPNYLTSMYENVDFNKVGVQTTMLTLDGTGRITTMSYGVAQFYGKGYGDTQWTPDKTKVTVFEVGRNFIDNSHAYQLNGHTYTGRRFFVGQATGAMQTRFGLGNNATNGTITSAGFRLIALKANVNYTSGTRYENGTSAGDITTAYDLHDHNIMIGAGTGIGGALDHYEHSPINQVRILTETAAENYDAEQAYTDYTS